MNTLEDTTIEENTALKLDLSDIEIKFNGKGEYGIHDGFFNAIVVIDNIEYDFQCCANDNADDTDNIDFSNCGYDDGLCGEANKKLSEKVGWDAVLELLEKAYSEYK